MKNYINRHIEARISKTLKAYPSVLITGPRQVGKSTLLKKCFPDIEYINLDDNVVLMALKQDTKGFLELQGTPLIIDEVQRAPEIFVSLKYQIDNGRTSGMYILTGSQRYQLMQGISDSLAGRISIIELLGFSNREINNESFTLPFIPTLEYLKQRKNSAVILPIAEVWKRIHRGSMPELYSNEYIEWNQFYADYFTTYIERDVRQLSSFGDGLTFYAFITAVAARAGELLNITTLARDVGIDERTAKRWLSILEASGIIFLLRSFSLNINKRMIKTPKVYFTDTGLICYLCRWLTADQLVNGAMAGAIYENYVISEILKSYLNTAEPSDMYFYRDTNGREIDLLIYKNNTLHPIEIKKTSSPNLKDIKHFSVLEGMNGINIGEGGVICNHDKLLPLQDGKYRIIPISYI